MQFLTAIFLSCLAAPKDENGFLVHPVDSPYQAGPTSLHILLPDPYDSAKKYPVVYVLPVSIGPRDRYGDGLLEIQKQGLNRKHEAIFAMPTFTALPWYADHPTDSKIRQESHFLKVILPFVEKSYPVERTAEGRSLLGFSKSGWGAFSVLLRHPETFGKAAAWDAPLMMDRPNKYGMEGIFGTQENFEKYQISRLVEMRKEQLKASKRLFLPGYAGFKEQHEGAHALLDKLAIPHEHRARPARKHDWHSGWVEEAIEMLAPGKAK